MVKLLQMKMMLLMAAVLMGVGTAWADDTYQRITSTDDLEIDAEYIIVSETNSVAMGTIDNSKGQGISVTISNGQISLSSSSTVNVLTLGGSSSGYTLLGSQDNNYIGYGGNNSTKLAANAKASTNSYKWTISFSGNNVSIANVETTNRYIKGYNTNKDFRAYATGNGSDVQLYKKVTASANATSVTIDDSNLSNTNLFDGTAAGSLSATVKDKDGQDISGATVTWTSENTSVATIANNGAVTLVAAGTTKITASYAGVSGTYDASYANYTLTVTYVPRYTASFNVNGTVTTSAEYTEDEAIVFPTDPTSINGFTFVGWCENVVTDGNKPTFVTSATMGDDDITFYAVFAVGTASGEYTYEKLSSDAFDTNATYVIGAKGASNDDNMYYLYSYSNKVDQNASYGLVSEDLDTNTPITFTLSGTSDALVAKDNSNNYLVGLTSANFRMSSSSVSVALSADGSIKNSSSGTYYLRYNTAGGLRWYSSNTGQKAYFYKVISGITYSDYCTTVPTKVSITVGASKFTSTYYSKYALVVPTGLTAYTFKVNASNKLEISETINAGQTIAKDQAVILYGDANTDYDLSITGTDGTKDANNVLHGFDEASTTTGGTIYYRLTTKGDASTIGFYWGAENGGAFTVGAHKAYVAVDAALSFGAGARMADIFAFDEANGIGNVNGETITNNRYFDLQGRRIAQPTKGLYIVNGKKMLVK